MKHRQSVLDHGHVILRNVAGPTRRTHHDMGMGQTLPSTEWPDFDANDRDPAQAARMSFDAMGTHTADEDAKLADYLMRNKHTTPFEMVELWIDMKMPIFVARQFVRHRTVSINEVSARYVQLPAEWYIPSVEVVGTKPGNIKQGRLINANEMDAGTRATAANFCIRLNEVCSLSYGHYAQAIKDGIPNELARSFLHLNHYTHWLWKQDLHNIMHFLSLRAHDHAQYEAQQYGYAIIELLRVVLPRTMELFDKYRRMP